jgi:hypothetical protein
MRQTIQSEFIEMIKTNFHYIIQENIEIFFSI